MLNVSSDDDAAADNAEDEVLPTGAVQKRLIMVKTENVTPLVPTVPGGMFKISSLAPLAVGQRAYVMVRRACVRPSVRPSVR